MNYLLDTHALLWYSLDEPGLSQTARRLITDPGHEIWVSPVSFWEIAIKVSIGKLDLKKPYRTFIDTCLSPGQFRWLAIEPTHTIYLAGLPFPPGHRDPFDRLLIAQSIIEDFPIIGMDAAFDDYPVRRVW